MPRTRKSQPSVGLPHLELNKESGGPLYLAVARHIEKSITSGHLSPGDRLDGEIGLAESLGVSRQTMRKAIDELVRGGLLVRRHGAGTQVLPTRSDRAGGVDGLYDELRRADRHPSTEVITLEVRAAEGNVAEELWLPADAEVIYLERVRKADEVPVAIMRNWIPADLIELNTADLEAHGLYEILREGGVKMRMAQQSIGAEPASTASARLLEVKKGNALLTIHTTTYNDAGKPVELGRHEYRGDMYRFPVTKVERQYGTEATR